MDELDHFKIIPLRTFYKLLVYGRYYGLYESEQSARIAGRDIHEMHERAYRLSGAGQKGLKCFLTQLEIARIEDALHDAKGNISAAARFLLTGRTTLIEKIKRFGLCAKAKEKEPAS